MKGVIFGNALQAAPYIFANCSRIRQVNMITLDRHPTLQPKWRERAYLRK
jgi:hypothetical protein